MSGSNYCFLTCIQISQEAGKWSGIRNSLRIFQFVVIHRIKDFSIVKEAEIDDFLELPWFSYDPMDAGTLISGSSAFCSSSLFIWNLLVHVLLKPILKNFEHYLAT